MPGIRVSTLIFSAPAVLWSAALDPQCLNRGGSNRSLQVLTPGELRVGSQFQWTVGERFPKLTCRSVLTRFEGPEDRAGFVAEGVSGTFSRWLHKRVVYPEREGSCWLEDRILYSPPGRALASWIDRRWVRDALIDLVMTSHRAVSRRNLTKSMSPEGTWEADAGTEFLEGPDWYEGAPASRSGAGRFALLPTPAGR